MPLVPPRAVPSPPSLPVALADPPPPAQPPPAEPTVQVTIGRLEVRAAIPAPAPEPRPKPRTSVSLDEYLDRRSRS
jgi:hypothetical protein